MPLLLSGPLKMQHLSMFSTRQPDDDGYRSDYDKPLAARHHTIELPADWLTTFTWPP